jgi:hypothetical protein
MTSGGAGRGPGMTAVIEWLIIVGLAAAAVYVLRYERPDPAAGGRPRVGVSAFVRFARMASDQARAMARMASDRARALVGRSAGEQGMASSRTHQAVDTERRAPEPLAEAG